MTDMINMSKKKPIIWTISGSDCSGGAGIAADIKTGHALGVEVCHLITANTVQNSTTLRSVNAVPVELLQQQVDILSEDKKPTVIKIGLVANAEQVQWLATTLTKLKQENSLLITVFDPVGQASVGGNFNTLSLAELTPLLTQIDVITPNVIEAKTLADTTGNSAVLAQKIGQDFAINAVVVKGGHSDINSVCIDLCYYQLNTIKQDNQDKTLQSISYQLSSPCLASHYSHGGGCTFASALAAFLAQGYLLRDAFTLSKAFINQGLAATVPLNAINGHQYYGAFEQLSWPKQAQYFPQVSDELTQKNQNLPSFNSLALQGEKLGLYPVIDSLYWLKRLLPLGLKIIQLRVKNLAKDELEQMIIDAVALAKDYETRLFINDYWQLAIKHSAYGVHIGQEDLADADLAQIQQAGLRLGISTHGCYEFLLAQQLQPSYLAVGAIFPTKTKDMTGQIQGISNLKQLLALRQQGASSTDLDNDQQSNSDLIPVVAIGGINLERAPQVLATGVDSIAVVTAITEAKQPEEAVAQFIAQTL
ncbi:thiamine phosphate synthase [Candidatus Colwellia aromaticivorans]|uniref:thiamine phosphate synthase n=1 Tax=Candidatus Colwellia aromaticivorans TaxID=2267621 RepID=UPI001FE44241|nr:thiamine phosphate synthase [Candidatus Colwellia aromaticivorans]